MEFNLADLFEIVADTCPDRTALVAGDARLTYRELDERANRVAQHLRGAGVQPGEWVALLAWNRAEWIEAQHGIYKARNAVVNVNYRYVAEELRYILDNSDAVAVVFERSFAPMVAEVVPDCPKLRHFVVIDDASTDAESAAAIERLGAVDYEAALAAASPARDGLGPRSSDDLYVLYTGGTTGMPKGVMWRAEDIFFAALGGGGFGQAPITTPDELAGRVAADGAELKAMINAPMMHGAGQWTSFIAFYAGGTVILNVDHHFDGDKVLRIVARERAATIMVVGDAMARPLAEALDRRPDDVDVSSVFMIGSGGSILSPAIKEHLRARLPNAMVMDSFGASETGAGGTVMDQAGPAQGPRFTVNPQMNVLDEQWRPIEPGSGTQGMLARRGHIPLGYWKDEEKTAATFVVDPDGERWVIPGDHALIEADGTITMLGRGSVCISSGGEKIFPEEVEAALKAHPAVFDAVVVGVPDERFVERVAAIIKVRDGMDVPTLDDIQAECRRHIAGYKVPRELHVTDVVPRTPVGKPDYRWAKRLAMGEPA
ncbi:MAG: acyl-CoA synthetase [Actinobacteria bacterium]|nr:acyl-CoA synthetase [Actinomycetota bacterium]